MAFWNLIEVFKDPELLARVLPELQTGVASLPDQDPSTPIKFDLTPVLSSPLLQSIYAEVLRMRISLLLTRTADRADFSLGSWKLSKGAYIAMPSGHIGWHEKAWQPHSKEGEKPADVFWAERFLVPDEEQAEEKSRTPKSAQVEVADSNGKMNGTSKTKEPEKKKKQQQQQQPKMRFSTEHLEGIWVPYGGGALMCPGRHLAKQEMMGGVLVFSAYYELEVAKGWVPKMDPFFYGMGAQQPIEPTPVRIRRKVGGWKTGKK